MPVQAPTPSLKIPIDQLINPGPRSGVIKHVPADGTLQAMVNICNPGDTIVVEPSYVLSAQLAFRAEKSMNTTTCPKRADGTPSDILIVANDPRFWNNATNTFVPPSARTITNKDYPAGRTVLKVSNRVVYFKDKNLLPKIQPSTFAGPLNFMPLGTTAPGDAPAFYRIVGLQIMQWATGQSSTVLVDFWEVPGIAAPGTYGAPHHIVIDRCLWVSDPADTGTGSAQVALYNWCGAYNAVINCDFHNFYGPGGGDPKMISWGGLGNGPYHFENNHAPVPNVIFTGGTGFAAEAGANFKNFTMLRNHCHRPLWLQPSEDPRPNFTVNIAADGVSVSAVSMPWGESFVAGDGNLIAQKGGLLVDPATGTCRRFAENGRSWDRTNITLDAPWPGAPVTNLPVHVVYSNYIYASDVTSARCTTNGTTHVTVSEPIPVTVIAQNDLTDVQKTQDIRAHYFFVTKAAPGWTVTSFPIFDTLPAHIKIISIDADRMGMTLESAPSVVGSQPYFVVAWDGKYRPAHGSASGKAFGEYKMAELCEHEGNIFENNAEMWRFHPTSQSDITITRTVTVSGTSITGVGLTAADTWWVGLSQKKWAFPTVDWPYIACWKDAWWAGTGAAGIELTSLDAGILHDSTLPAGTYQVEIRWMAAPQAKVADQLWRYNIFKQFTSGPSVFPNTNVWEVRQSERFHWVDNLQMDFGAKHLPGAPTGEIFGHPISQGGPGSSAIPLGQGQRVAYGQPAHGTLPHMRFSHNTAVRAITNGAADFLTVTHDTAPTTDADRSTDWEISDNVGHATAGVKSLLGHYNQADPTNLPAYVIGANVGRNVFTAPNAPTKLSTLAANYPDNAALSDIAQIGFADPAAISTSPLTAYSLVDVSNTGTVSISADGLTVTRSGGLTFPSTVQSGQFFKAATSTARTRITVPATSPLGSSWFTGMTGFGAMEIWSDRVRSSAGSTCGAVYSAQALPSDCWVSVTTPTGVAGTPGGILLQLRQPASATLSSHMTFFFVNSGQAFLSDTTFGDTGTLNATIGANTEILFEAIGSLLKVSTRPAGTTGAFTAFMSGTMPSGVLGTGTFALIGTNGGVGDAQLDNFACGDYSSPGVRRTLATETFTSPAPTSLTLASPYDVALRGTTGQAYTIGFKGTGTDSRDPGADIPAVIDFTAGVDTLIEPDTVDSIVPSAGSVLPGGSINVTWHSVGAMTTGDMIGLFQGTSGFLDWAYVTSGQTAPPTPAAADGTVTIPISASRVPGSYTLGFYRGSTQLATAPLTVSTPADTTAPAVSITAPANNATVSGTMNVTTTVTDAVGVASVRLFVDGVQSGAALTTAPYTFSLNTATLTNTAHTLRVDGLDAAGNTGSASISVTVNNVVADTTAPVVNITAPANGATISGTVNVTATATDAVGVSTVKFYVDGIQTGATLTSAPFTYGLDTATLSNGSHTIRVDAADVAGNVGSASVSVTVSNTVIQPLPVTTSSAPTPAPRTKTVKYTIQFANVPPGQYTVYYELRSSGTVSISGASTEFQVGEMPAPLALGPTTFEEV